MKAISLLPMIGLMIITISVGIAADANTAGADDHQYHDGHHRHKAHHGGALNVIGFCENGHIEVRVREDTLEAWFVGGGHDTERAVPIAAEEIPLLIKAPGIGQKHLVLQADPMTLAGEKAGRCSRFSARADWLRGMETFEAAGSVIFKGQRQELMIRYPEGYDPDHR